MSATLSPDSGVSLDIKMGKFLISIYDKPSLPQFQTDALTQRDQIQYNQFTNTAGINVLWDVNSRTTMSLRYDRSNSFSISSEDNTPDLSTDSFMASLACQLTDSLGVGIEAQMQSVKYDSNSLNDGTTYNIGPFINYRLSNYTQLQASFGYQVGDYENTGEIGDESSLGTYYTNVSISNRLNNRLNHSLSLGRQSQRGSLSNFAINSYIKYQINWDLVRNVNLGGSASFSDVEESGGLFAEHFRTYSLGLFCSFRLNQHISMSLLYAFSKRYVTDESRTEDDLVNFTENRISLRLDQSRRWHLQNRQSARKPMKSTFGSKNGRNAGVVHPNLT
jgi:hypothetical protein